MVLGVSPLDDPPRDSSLEDALDLDKDLIRRTMPTPVFFNLDFPDESLA
jgi:hypothetical protein